MIIDLCLSLGIMFIFARAGGWIARKLSLPEISGEILAGVFLGPTLLGTVFPEIFHQIFDVSAEVSHARHLVLKAGMLFFLFLAGTEMSLSSVKERFFATVWVSLSGILLPFMLGILIVYLLPEYWKRYTHLPLGTFSLFLGVAFSISALPVIARILIHLRLIRTPMAGVVMTAATIDDILGWTCFSWILLSSRMGFHFQEFLPLAVFWAGVFTAPYLHRWKKGQRVLFFTAFTIVAPVYFVSIGMKTNFFSHLVPGLAAGIFLIACLGKIGGVALGAWLGGFPRREIWGTAFAMNARGAMEIILATLALEAGLILEPVFVSLVIMAVATSVLAAVSLNRIYPSAPDCEGV